MAVLSFRQPVSLKHAAPLTVLTIITILVANFSLEKSIPPQGWKTALLVGWIFTVGIYFASGLINRFPFKKTKWNKLGFESYVFMRTPLSYAFFVARILPMCLMSSLCLLLLVGTALASPPTERTALTIFTVGTLLLALSHVLIERKKLGHNAWSYIP